MASGQQSLPTPLALPEGGDLVQGFDPAIRADGFSGAATLSVPLPITPLPAARGTSPELELTYNSGAGNGACGLGFALATPAITRLTSRGVPDYEDGDQYALTGAGPLTPAVDPATARPVRRLETDPTGADWAVVTFLPCQLQGLPLIEQWTQVATGASHWRTVSSRGATSTFGATELGRVSDPADSTRIFQWLIEETADTHGNRIVFDYKAENGAAVRNEIYERERVITAQRYPDRIRYGNYYPDATADDSYRTGGPTGDGAQQFAFEAVFDYGEYDLDVSNPDPYVPVRDWPERADPFSSYIAGFEIRTYRLCRGVLMFQHFPAELGQRPCLARATRFGYTEARSGSVLTSVTTTGYRRSDDGSYDVAPMAPLDLSYSVFDPPPVPRFRQLQVHGCAAVPGYLGKGAYLPVDLDGDGLPGFLLSSGATAWYYPPEGNGRYGTASPLPSVPDSGSLADPRLSVEDLDGNGGLQLLVYSTAATGYFARTRDSWAPFMPLRESATTYAAPHGELADLDGDGRAELLFVNRDELVFYPSLGTAGFGPPRALPRQPGFPAAANATVSEVVTFAGAFGDALAHRVRITDGEVAIWPNLGHGRFAPRVLMAGAPRLPRGLDTGRIYLADLDRTGTADLVLAFPDHLMVYRNQSGNSFAPPLRIPLPFQLTSHDQVSFGDVLGTGTTAIIVSRMVPEVQHWCCDLCEPAGVAAPAAPAASGAPAGLVDEPGFPGPVAAGWDGPPVVSRPYLLTGADNNLGAVGAVSYASSTQFLLADKRAGRPWLTRMPVAIQVVAQTITRDLVGATQATTRYRYHDGYFDPYFRQFEGFGLVDRSESQRAPGAPPTTRTRTWYHAGAYTESAALLARRRAEYFRGDPDAGSLPDSVLEPAVLAAGGESARQAYRALAGRVVHTEMYGADPEALPYGVTDSNYTVVLVQAAAAGRLASFYVSSRESVGYDYQREPADPRIEHSVVLASTLADPGAADCYLERVATVAYPRRPSALPGRDRVPEQQVLRVVVDEGWYTRITDDFRLIGMPVQTRRLDVGGLVVPPGGYFSFGELHAAVDAALASEIPYGTAFTTGVLQSRPETWHRVYYWDAAQTAALPLGEISAAALHHHTEQAAFSAAWLASVFDGRASNEDLVAAGYLAGDGGYWWSPGEVTSFYRPGQPAMFALPCRSESYALHYGLPGPYALTTGGYGAPYSLLATVQTRYADAETPITTTGQPDYQAARLRELADANGVVGQVLFDPLGDVLASSVFKPATGQQPRVGDMDLLDYQVRADATFAAVLADRPGYLQEAAAFYFYDRLAWLERGSPVGVIAVTATQYLSDGGTPPRPAQTTIRYGDGSARLVEQRQEAEPASRDGADRWIVVGPTTYTAAGQPAREYLPYYAASPEFAPPQAAPPPRLLCYDAVSRLIAVQEPKGLLTRTGYGAWQRRDYDEDDTVLDAPFYVQFMASYPASPTPAQRAQKDALDQAARCYDTPDISVLDNAGNPVRAIRDSLGNIAVDAFAAIVAGSGVSSAQLWDELHAKGYLSTSPLPAPHTGLTGLFEPYTPGFSLHLDSPYEQFAADTTELLRQGCLTSFAAVDSQARLVQAIDPRLYYDNCRAGTAYSGTSYAYQMGQDAQSLAVSPDSGPRWALADVAGRTVSGWDGRELRQDNVFDGLARLVTLSITPRGAASSTLEVLTYGDHQDDAAARNLIGRGYLIRDEAGTLLTAQYTISGLPVTAVRQYPVNYAAVPDWSGDVPLDAEFYPTTLRYDALGRPTNRTTPDGCELTIGYHVSGRLAWLHGEQDGAATVYLADAAYTAAGQRLASDFGNGARQLSDYDAATQRLTSLVTRQRGGAPVQQVAYTYDPVGNVTQVRDETAALVLTAPQPPGTRDYTFDATYRLRRATGIQHPGIDATTYATGFKQTLFAGLPAADLDAVVLEPYTETYSYDDAGNLVDTEHTAASESFPRPNPVAADSDRLADVRYDGAGNPLSMTLTEPVELTWDARGNLAATARVPRPDGGSEQTWFGYDFYGERARKVVERFDSAGQLTQTEELRFVGSYTGRRLSTPELPLGGAAGSVLRVDDGDQPVAVVDSASGSRQTRYQVADLLGSVGVELAADATVLTYEGFFPAGGSSVIAAREPAVAEAKMIRYGGEYADDSTSLYYYGARYLAPWLGRWLSADPAGQVDGLNLYGFVRGNPVTLTDVGGYCNGDPNDPGKNPFEQIKKMLTGGSNTPRLPIVLRPQREGPQVLRFLNSAGSGTLFALFNAPIHTLYLGPMAVYQRYFAPQETRELSRTNRDVRRNELQTIGYHALIVLGLDPESSVAGRFLRWLRPANNPLSGEQLGRLGVPLQFGIDWAVRQPETYGSYIGGYLGSFATVGLTATMLRRFLGRNLSPRTQLLTMPLPWLVGLLGLLGRGQDRDRQWNAYERLRDQIAGPHRPEVIDFENNVVGIPRFLVYQASMQQAAERYGDYAGVGVIIAVLSGGVWGLLARRGGSWPFRGGGPGGGSGRSTALTVYNPPNRDLMVRRERQRSLTTVPERPGTALMIRSPRPSAVVPYQPRPGGLIQPQLSPLQQIQALLQGRLTNQMLLQARLTYLAGLQQQPRLPMVINPVNQALASRGPGNASRTALPVNLTQIGSRNFATVIGLLVLNELYRRLMQQQQKPPLRKPPGSDKPPNN